MLYYSIVLIILFWVLDAIVDGNIFYSNSKFIDELLSPNAFEVYFRLLISVLIIAFGTYAYMTINRRKKLENALRESEKRYRRLVEIIPDGVAIHHQGRIVYTNMSGAKILGFSEPGEVLGKPLTDFMLPHIQEATGGQFDQEQAEMVMEKKIMQSDGKIIDIEVNTTPIDHDGKPSLLFVARDVTDRKRDREAIKESELRYRQLVELIPEAVAVYNNEKIVFANSSAARMLGIEEPRDLIGKAVTEFVTPQFGAAIREPLMKVLREGALLQHYEEKLTRTDGIVVDIEIAATSITYQGEKALLITARDITERKQAEEAQKKSEANYRSIFNAANEVIFIHDLLTGEITDVNDRIDMYGYTPQEALNLDIEAISSGEPPYSQKEALGWVAKAAREGPQLFEWLAKKKNGELFWVEVNLKGAEISGKQSMMAIVRDIADRKQAEKSLEMERVQLLAIFDSINEVIYVSDPDTYEILYANMATKKKYKKELIGGKCYKELEGYDEPCPWCINDMLLKTSDKPYQWEHHSNVLNGDFAIMNKIIQWPDGRDVKFELAVDITERKKAMQALRESEDKYRAIFENTGTATVIIGEDTTISMANTEFERLTGLTKGEIEGKMSWTEMVVKEDLDKMVQYHYERRQRGENAPSNYEFRLMDKEGKVKNIHLTIGMMPDKQKSVASLLDVTARKQAERERMEANAQVARLEKLASLGTMAAGIAHEVAQPLNAIKVMVDGTLYWHKRGKEPQMPKVLENLNKISSQILRIEDIIKRVQSFVRLQGHAKDLCDLNHAIESALRIVGSQLNGHGIKVHKKLSKELPPVWGIANRLEEIVINLLNNAMQSLETVSWETKEITCQTMLKDQVILEISDNGPGVDEEIRGMIFEPLFTTKLNGNNMGLGLTIVSSIIASSHGKIEVFANERGGATFRVSFPRASELVQQS